VIRLLLVVVLSQTVFEFYDPAGGQHFTKDPDLVPQRAEWRVFSTTDGGVPTTFEWADERGVTQRTTDPHQLPHRFTWRVARGTRDAGL